MWSVAAGKVDVPLSWFPGNNPPRYRSEKAGFNSPLRVFLPLGGQPPAYDGLLRLDTSSFPPLGSGESFKDLARFSWITSAHPPLCPTMIPRACPLLKVTFFLVNAFLCYFFFGRALFSFSSTLR